MTGRYRTRRRGSPAIGAGALVVTVMMISSCGSSGVSLDGATGLDYLYGDSSVAPEYHRSYTLTLDVDTEGGPASGTFVVDSYGEVLHTVDVTVDAATWSSVIEDLGALDQGSVDDDDGCTGGTSRGLTVRSADGGTLVERTISACGGVGVDEAAELDEAIGPLLADLDLATLLAPDA